jgi:hypothetical protein
VRCPGGCFVLEPGVRLRPVPELGVCLAYTPARPALHRLNATAWLIASLCDGRPFAQIAAAYAAALPGATEASLREGIAQLQALGILRKTPTGERGEGP